MKKIRLVALDVDGTLLDDSKELPAVNREALEEASARGVLVAIASGRMTPRIEAIEEKLGIDCIIIAYNGAKVVGRKAEGRALIARRPVPAEVAELFIRFSRETGHLLNFYDDDLLYSEDSPQRRPFIDLYAQRTGAEFHIVDDLRQFLGVTPTKLILIAAPEERDRLHDEFREKLSGRAFITRSEPEYLEIMASGVDKGSGLRSIAEHYDISREEILAVGDAPNDLELIQAAGWGVGVANCSPLVREAADAVTERTNNEGGVAEAVRRWVLDEGS